MEKFISKTKNSSKYSKNSFEEALEQYLDNSSEFFNEIVNSLFNQKTYNTEDYEAAINKRKEDREEQRKTIIGSFSHIDELGSNQLQGLLKIYDTISGYVDNELIDKSRADNFITQYD